LFLAAFHELLEFLSAAACGKTSRDWKRRQTRSDEHIAALVALDYPRHLVAKFPVDPLDPQIGRLHHVRVRRDYMLRRHWLTLLSRLGCLLVNYLIIRLPPDSVKLDVVELHRILEDDLVLYVVGHALEVLLDNLERVRPGRIGVREIRGPHKIVFAEILVRH